MILPERVLGSSGVKTIDAGRAILPILSATWFADLLDEILVADGRPLQGAEGGDGLTGALVGRPDHGRLRHGGVVDEGPTPLPGSRSGAPTRS